MLAREGAPFMRCESAREEIGAKRQSPYARNSICVFYESVPAIERR